MERRGPSVIGINKAYFDELPVELIDRVFGQFADSGDAISARALTGSCRYMRDIGGRKFTALKVHLKWNKKRGVAPTLNCSAAAASIKEFPGEVLRALHWHLPEKSELQNAQDDSLAEITSNVLAACGASRLATIQTLDVKALRLSQPGGLLSLLCFSPGLQSITLSNCVFRSCNIIYIGQLAQLKALRLNRVTLEYTLDDREDANQLRQLQPLGRTLQTLQLNYVRYRKPNDFGMVVCGNVDLSSLVQHMTLLRHLDISTEARLTEDAALAVAPTLTGLRLAIDGGVLKNGTARPLRHFRSLTAVELGGEGCHSRRIKAVAMDVLLSLPELRTVSLTVPTTFAESHRDADCAWAQLRTSPMGLSPAAWSRLPLQHLPRVSCDGREDACALAVELGEYDRMQALLAEAGAAVANIAGSPPAARLRELHLAMKGFSEWHIITHAPQPADAGAAGTPEPAAAPAAAAGGGSAVAAGSSGSCSSSAASSPGAAAAGARCGVVTAAGRSLTLLLQTLAPLGQLAAAVTLTVQESTLDVPLVQDLLHAFPRMRQLRLKRCYLTQPVLQLLCALAGATQLQRIEVEDVWEVEPGQVEGQEDVAPPRYTRARLLPPDLAAWCCRMRHRPITLALDASALPDEDLQHLQHLPVPAAAEGVPAVPLAKVVRWPEGGASAHVAMGA